MGVTLKGGRAAAAASALGAIALLGGVPAQASIISRTLEFTATGFLDGQNNATAPTDPVTGSFSITFDNSADTGALTAGFTLLGLNIPVQYTVYYSYLQAFDRLSVGGFGSQFCGVASGTDNFCMLIVNISDPLTTSAGTMFYASTTDPSHVWTTHAVRLNDITGVPEPASLALLGLGLCGLGVARRRRG